MLGMESRIPEAAPCVDVKYQFVEGSWRLQIAVPEGASCVDLYTEDRDGKPVHFARTDSAGYFDAPAEPVVIRYIASVVEESQSP